MIDCAPIDDTCHLQADYAEVVEAATLPPYVVLDGLDDTKVYIFNLPSEGGGGNYITVIKHEDDN